MAEEDKSNEVETKINEITSKAVKNDKGVLELPDEALEGVELAIAHAAKTELRYRNTQSDYTKTKQEKAKLEKVKDKLTEKLADNMSIKLSKEQEQELTALKDDPEAYHNKRTELENKARQDLQSELETIEQESANLSEREVRELKLKAFNEQSPVQITDELIQNELPNKYLKQLEKDEVSFDQFLINVQDYFTKDKVIDGAGEGDKDPDPDMNRMAGGGEPSRSSTEGDVVETYKNTVY